MLQQQESELGFKEIEDRIKAKIDSMIPRLKGKSPHTAPPNGIYDDNRTDAWTSGFWPGLLWLLYDRTGEEKYKSEAWAWDARFEQHFIEPSQFHHDVGFQFLPTAVFKYKVTGDEDAKRRGLEAANFLCGRFNLAGSFIRAWNPKSGEWNDGNEGWAIIDCMMNLSLLFWASEESGDPRFKHIAIAHADMALRHFVREDGSTRHICCFDPETGAYTHELGGQGYAPGSAWSRGTAWALYGFANTYRFTKEERYLQAAKRISHFFLSQLNADPVPLWDFRTDSPAQEPVDTSAGAIAASGLIELSKLVPAAESGLYLESAKRMLAALSERYATWEQPEHEAILTHGTGNKPQNKNIGVSLIYGDYYFAEAVAKLNGWDRNIF